MKVKNHLVLGAVGALFLLGSALAVTGGRGISQQGSFLQSGTGAQLETIETSLRRYVSVSQYGALCNGSADDAAALINANTAAVAANRTLVIDCKVRLASAAGTISAPLEFRGNGAIDYSNASASVTLTGSVLAPTSQIFFTGSGTLSFGAADVGQVLVQWWGAAGDGVHDDTTALSAAVNSRANGQSVYLPPGIYLTTSAIAIPANTAIVGDGMPEAWNGTGIKGSVIKNTTNGNTFTITNTTGVRIEGVTLYGSTSTGAHLLIDGGAGASSEIIVNFSTFLGKDNAVKMTNTVFQVFLIRSIFSAQNSQGILIDASAGSGDTSIYIRECWVRGSGAEGIKASGASGIVNFVVEKSQVSNITANNSAAISLNTVNGGEITNTDIETITGTGTSNGIWLQGSSAINVNGNTLLDVRGNAPIYGSTLYRSRIGPNRILKGSSVASYAIQLDSGSFDNIISDQSTDFAVPSGVVLDSGTYNIIMVHGLVTTRSLATTRTALTYGVSVATDASLGNSFTITATNGTAFAIANPTNLTAGQRLLYTIRNTSGGALGTTTWGATFKVAAPTALTIATGNSLSIEFVYDGTNLIEIFRTPVVVPN